MARRGPGSISHWKTCEQITRKTDVKRVDKKEVSVDILLGLKKQKKIIQTTNQPDGQVARRRGGRPGLGSYSFIPAYCPHKCVYCFLLVLK